MAKVSVCIPTYNRANLLHYAVNSVLNQTYNDFELIITDDGSKDNTAEVVSQWNDSRIRYIRHPQNIGKSNNMRSGFDAATGEYFIKFDDDDGLTSDFLEKSIFILDQNPSIDFVGTDHWVIDINNQRDQKVSQLNSQKWGRTQLSEGIVNNLLEIVFINQSFQIGATLFRNRTLNEVGFMRPNMQNCEDNDLFVRLALAGKTGYYLPEKLMEYRFHAQQHGINRAIPYLTDKLNYLQQFNFELSKLESVRKSRLAETQLMLGLLLIETGQTQEGRQMVWEQKSFSPLRAWTGLALSILPIEIRDQAFKFIRRLRS